MSKAKRPQAEESLRERCRKLFKLTPIQATVAWRQVTEHESHTASYAAALAERGKVTKTPEVQVSKLLRLTKVREAIAWLRRELGILAEEKAEETSAALRRAKILRMLEAHVDGNLDDVFAGALELRWTKISRETKALLRKVKKVPVIEKGKVLAYREEVELHDPQKAADIINRMDGNYITQVDPNIQALLDRLAIHAAARKAKGK